MKVREDQYLNTIASEILNIPYVNYGRDTTRSSEAIDSFAVMQENGCKRNVSLRRFRTAF